LSIVPGRVVFAEIVNVNSGCQSDFIDAGTFTRVTTNFNARVAVYDASFSSFSFFIFTVSYESIVIVVLFNIYTK
jgi:hypothetical protein